MYLIYSPLLTSSKTPTLNIYMSLYRELYNIPDYSSSDFTEILAQISQPRNAHLKGLRFSYRSTLIQFTDNVLLCCTPFSNFLRQHYLSKFVGLRRNQLFCLDIDHCFLNEGKHSSSACLNLNVLLKLNMDSK